MNKKEIIKRLREELEQLRQKIMNLKIFLETNKFFDIITNHQKQGELLKLQLEAMEQYQNILISRIALIQDLIDEENGDK